MSKDDANAGTAKTAVADTAPVADPEPVADAALGTDAAPVADTVPLADLTATPNEQDKTGLAKTVFVCSPYRATSKNSDCRRDELAANVERARHACRILTLLGLFPLAPHLYFTQFLRDEVERERRDGMEMGLRWLEQSDEVWVFGETVSEGMAKEIAHAKELGKPVRCLPEPGRLVELLLKGASQMKEAGQMQGAAMQGASQMKEQEDEHE